MLKIVYTYKVLYFSSNIIMESTRELFDFYIFENIENMK